MRISQSPSLFITVVLLICSTALLLQCTEGATKVRNVLASDLKSCKRKEGNVVSSCRFLLNNTVQASDSSLKSCCQTVGQAELGQDCLCLIQESERATPSSNPSDIETLKVLEAVSSNKQFISSCAALNGIEDNCSGVAKALKRAAEINDTTLEYFEMVLQCDKTALKLRDVCGLTVAKAQSGSKINTKQAQTIVCCNELEKFRKAECACILGSTVTTSKDIVDFLADVSTVGDKLSKACRRRSFRANITQFCPNPTNQQGNKKPLLFDKCETTAQEAVKTCTPKINEAIAEFKNTKPISVADKKTNDCCDRLLKRYPSYRTEFEENQLYPSQTMSRVFQTLGCVCNMTVYKEFEKASEAEKVRLKTVRNNPQSVSCCNQLSKLIESPPQSCLCNITHHKTVTSRATTTDFLTAGSIVRAVEEICGPKISLSNYDCVVRTPYVYTPSEPEGFWAKLVRSYKEGRLFSGKGLCFPGVSGSRGC